MKRLKIIPFVFALLLTGCDFIFGGDGYYVEASYVLNDSTTELRNSISITYGEKFNVDHFVLSKVNSDGSKSKIDSSKYTIVFTEGDRESFFSSRPNVGSYNVLFEYQTKTSSLAFNCKRSGSFLEEDACIVVDDIDFNDLTQKPMLMNCIDQEFNGDFEVTYLTEGPHQGERYTYPYRDNQYLRMTLFPGEYRIQGTINSTHYYDVPVSTTFNVRKIYFPSNEYYVKTSSLNVTYMEGYKYIGSYYTPSNPQVRSKVGNSPFPGVFDEYGSLEWKNPNEEVDTNNPKTYTLIYKSPYFHDFEFNVVITMKKCEVNKPTSFLANGQPFNNSAHEVPFKNAAYTVTYSFFGSGYSIAEGSVLEATNCGTYTITFKLTDPDNMVWADIKTSEDFVFTWKIVQGSHSALFNAYYFEINGITFIKGQVWDQNVFTKDQLLNQKLKMYVLYFGDECYTEYTLINVTIENMMYSGEMTVENNVVTSISFGISGFFQASFAIRSTSESQIYFYDYCCFTVNP